MRLEEINDQLTEIGRTPRIYRELLKCVETPKIER
jgi:hypothetical protein